jgi:hypothetical protein
MAKPTAGQLSWIIVIVLGVAALPFIITGNGQKHISSAKLLHQHADLTVTETP